MELRVKLSRPADSHLHNLYKQDTLTLLYYLKRDDTLETLINNLRINLGGLSKNYKLIFNGTNLNTELRKT